MIPSLGAGIFFSFSRYTSLVKKEDSITTPEQPFSNTNMEWLWIQGIGLPSLCQVFVGILSVSVIHEEKFASRGSTFQFGPRITEVHLRELLES